MNDDVNQQLVLRARPTGVVADDNFELIEQPVANPGDGQILVRTLWLSFEPAQRGWLNDVKTYVPPVAIGEAMRSWGVGQVLASGHPGFSPGQLVHGTLHWQTHALLDMTTESNPPVELAVIPPEVDDPKLMLSVAGVTGLTAYFGMSTVGRPVEGDVVLVTAAAGATGSVAGQVARNLGAERVIGTAGSEDKRSWVRDVAEFDDCVDHYDEKIRRRLREAAPGGYDVVFDNVGGSLLDAALFNIAEHGRIALCGSISTGYRPERPEVGLHYYQLLTTRRARMEGFLLSDFEDRFADARRILLGWYADGRLHVEHDVLEGLSNAPLGLRRLFDGGNLGKQILHIADPT
ncbi:MAG TPA: NADP-dependent oxidoreductase [Ilumatobacter sp.]|nr:NADP-dependent oxidoreductase [Ilumatobacter sp.]